MTKNKIVLALLIVAALIKQLLWSWSVPVFQTPDEQAHFAQLQYLAENRTLNLPANNLSLEIATAEELLGTRRDKSGNNKYTYHPEYKNNSPIPAMPISSRTIYVGSEAAGYPPLYYLTAWPVYQLFYNSGLVDRLFAVRLVSLIFYLGLVAATYKIGQLVFADKFLAGTLTVLVAFQPMISFVAAGFHPDNLLNLISTIILGVCLLVLKNGVRIKYVGALGLLLLLGMETKPFMVFFLPLVIGILVYQFFKGRRLGTFLAIGAFLSPVLAFVLKFPIPYMPNVTTSSPLVNMGFIEYLRFRVPKLMFEMWPWYWGVFKWLGVTLPPVVMKVITRVGIIAAIGVVFSVSKKYVVFFVLATGSYVLYMFLWDFRLMQSIGFSQGLQGRYLLPNILPEMALLLMGITTLFGRFRKTGAIILSLAMIILNGIALYVVYQNYYDLSSWQAFLAQVVQYK